jgi:hypothetical protein
MLFRYRVRPRVLRRAVATSSADATVSGRVVDTSVACVTAGDMLIDGELTAIAGLRIESACCEIGEKKRTPSIFRQSRR